MTVHIVALMGAAQSGKTTISKFLQERGYQRARFAGPLKEMLHTLGLTWEQLDGSEKEVPSDLLGGKTPRHAMQTIGTEWRDMIDTRLWTNVMEKNLTEMIFEARRRRKDALIVIDDCRFPHEVDMLRKMGGEVWTVRRAAVEPSALSRAVSRLPRWLRAVVTAIVPVKVLHPSELYWSSIEPDVSLFNNDGLDELFEVADAVLYERRTGIPA